MKNVIGVSSLKNVAKGEVVELPCFDQATPFFARLRRTSLLGLAASGVIPNPLLAVAEEIFGGKIVSESANFRETAEVFRIVAEHALVEPSFKQIEECGVSLTDLQYLAIFNYTQMGVKGLSGFHSEQVLDAHN